MVVAGGDGMAREEREGEGEGDGDDRCCCWCADLWREGTGDLWKLERACEAVRAELDRAATSVIEGGGASDCFAPFDSAVHQGGEWSAVYLWRNGVRDDANCDAFPVTAAVVDSLAHAAYLNHAGGGGGIGGDGGVHGDGKERAREGIGGCALEGDLRAST